MTKRRVLTSCISGTVIVTLTGLMRLFSDCCGINGVYKVFFHCLLRTITPCLSVKSWGISDSLRFDSIAADSASK